MKKSEIITLVALLMAAFLPCYADGNGNTPEGWATCSSIFTAGDYDMKGGNEGSVIVLRSDGADMRDAILKAAISHDVIVFDGVNGDFIVSQSVVLQSVKDKTFVGVNGACLRTVFSVTQEIRDLLDKLDVNSLSQSPGDNLGGTLSNGIEIVEQRELAVRQALIDHFGDPKEPYRHSGVFFLRDCSNIIVSNLDFVGPGSIDVGGFDLLTIERCDHVWVDHCRFTDGMDGNVDVVDNSDFITFSDTHFQYTDKSYNHPLSNLTWGTATTDGSPQKNNISWLRCFWGYGCTGRMPRISYGIHHLLNCYWDCSGGTSVDAVDMSKVLLEGCYFTNRVARALAVRKDDILYECRGCVWDSSKSLPESNAKIELPYAYTAEDVAAVPGRIKKSVGPTLADPFRRELSSSPAAVDFGKVYADNQISVKINISAFGSDVPSVVTLTAPEGIFLSTEQEGEYSPVLVIEATDKNLIQADVYVRASFSRPGDVDQAITVSASGRTFTIPVKAEVVGLGGERREAAVMWPLDGGAAGGLADALTAQPEVFGESVMHTGAKINLHSSKKIGGSLTFTLFNPTELINKGRDEECYVTFDVNTAPGYVFVPRMLTFNAARIGTDMCAIDVECSRGAEAPRTLLTGFQPVRSSDAPYYSEVELPLENAGVGESLQIKVYLYNMYDNKQLALGNVRIEGDAYVRDSAAAELIVSDEKSGAAEYYDLTGRRIVHPRSGRVYVRHSDSAGSKKVYISDSTTAF